MPNPLWTLRGSLEVPPGMTPAEQLDRIENGIADLGKRVFDRDGPTIVYSSWFWEDALGINRNPLLVYDRGRLWLDGSGGTSRLRYELSSLRFLLLCFAIAAAAGLFIGSQVGWRESAKVAFVGLAWLYGLNLLVALVRVPRFFRRLLR